MEWDQIQLVESLQSTTCPMCGGTKKPKQTACLMCYSELPSHLKRRLYCRIGEGYEEAFADAAVALDVRHLSPPA